MTKLPKPGPYDISNLGVLCERIRRGRGLFPEVIARHCGVSNETISRNVELWGKSSRKTFECYLKTLAARQIDEIVVEQPLTNDQVAILRHLHRTRHQQDKLQCRLAALDFETIYSPKRPANFEILLEQMANQPGPALILDSLWFIHAINGAALTLFGLSPESEYLKQWHAWHLLAAKFPVDSPVRQAHRYTDQHYPLTVRTFFEDENSYPYLFTLQMRVLLAEMHRLSAKYDYNFTKWWLQASKFNLPFDPEPLVRNVVYNDQEIQVVGMQPNITQSVRVAPSHTLPFRLTGWQPFNEQAKQVFAHLMAHPDSQTIYFAADFDRQNSFYINMWSQVKPHIKQWLAEGRCV